MNTNKPTLRFPWKVATNEGGPDDQPAFPCVVDHSGLPHGEDIICQTLGDSETCKELSKFIAMAGTSAHQCEALGFDGTKCVENVGETLKQLQQFEKWFVRIKLNCFRLILLEHSSPSLEI